MIIVNLLRDLWCRWILRPLSRAFAMPRRQPHIATSCHCCACGYRGVFVLAESAPEFDRETCVVDMLECPDCGLHTICSD